jgi:hypothetical protein
MSVLYLLSTHQIERIEPYFPLAHGVRVLMIDE